MDNEPMPDESPAEQRGPSGYENWKLFVASEPSRGVVEFTLYTDAHVTGEILDGLGPFTVLNTVAIGADRPGEPLPAMVLRCQIHGSGVDPPLEMDQRDDTTWHAGGIDDEMAALLSLALGVRIRSGGPTREFTGGEPLGAPIQHSHSVPYLPRAGLRRVLPSAGGTHRIDAAAGLLSMYPSMPVGAAVTLVRAARAYQEGVWVSESDPEYTWLKLVSAVEAAADYWWQQDIDAVELLEAWDDDMKQRLEQAGGAELVSYVAERLVPVTRATRKFLAFLDEYLPGPPPNRPKTGRIDWDTVSNGLKLVYKYRSQSLHSGKPFPGPLLSAPFHAPGPAEKPFGLSSAVGDAVWLAKDLPMYLHVFEHIVRGALHSWWRHVGSPDS